MTDGQKLVLSKVLNAIIVAVGTICNVLFAGN